MCLISNTIVDQGRTPCRFSRAPQLALGGLLALLLLVATTFSVSHTLHQFLHPVDAGVGHICLACSFAKGHVSPAAVALVAAVLVLCCFWVVRLVHRSPFSGFDHCTSPSRAPPTLFSFLSVVA